MEKVNLTRIYTTDKDKNGNSLISKQGKPYTRMSIMVKEHGEKWISGFKSQSNSDWKEGDEVEIIIKKNGEYLNFETPKGDTKVIEMLSLLLTKVGSLNSKVDYLAEKLYPREKAQQESNSGFEYPEEDISPDDIPF